MYFSRQFYNFAKWIYRKIFRNKNVKYFFYKINNSLSLFGVLCGILCHLTIYLTKNYTLIFLGFILYGLGIGCSYYPILKTSWKYFPEKKGILTGIILSVFGLCPLIFTSICDFIVNKDGESAGEGDIFDPKIAIRLKKYCLLMVFVLSFFGLLSQILMFPMDKIDSTDLSDKKYNNDPLMTNETSIETKNFVENVNLNQPFKQAFCSIRFHLFNIMSVGTLFFGFLCTHSNRTFGTKKGLNEHKLQTMSKICSFLNASFRIIWGLIYDKLGFKIPYLIVAGNQILVSAFFYFSANNINTYFLSNILENLSFSGHGTIAPPIVSKIFGVKNTTKLIGCTGYFIGSAGMIGPLLVKFFVNNVYDGNLKGYLIVFWIGTFLAIIGFFIAMFLSEKKFEYNVKKMKNLRNLLLIIK